ncbi:hypothetical protein SG34_015835 [Thalassomonas viridans]|uniref:Uncharacterized protein n=1 Tax=Thalassomonas viridans TaxID=137584 RepID=A0AAE9Z0E2_9GAMM|nr:hypothetical protein [Thalassomonas viridans]WDE02912.1 hypothetical protein SG34_015835 [Thalassomonas viridans]
MSDSFAALAHNPEAINELTIEGFDHYALWLRMKAEEFDDRIKQLHLSLKK